MLDAFGLDSFNQYKDLSDEALLEFIEELKEKYSELDKIVTDAFNRDGFVPPYDLGKRDGVGMAISAVRLEIEARDLKE